MLGAPVTTGLAVLDMAQAGRFAAVDRPILILQGGRDYQTTVAEDLAGWKAGLAGRPDVTIRIYPPDNHFFFPGAGPSAPAESEPAQHVDPAPIADIASWLATASGHAGRPGPGEPA